MSHATTDAPQTGFRKLTAYSEIVRARWAVYRRRRQLELAIVEMRSLNDRDLAAIGIGHSEIPSLIGLADRDITRHCR